MSKRNPSLGTYLMTLVRDGHILAIGSLNIPQDPLRLSMSPTAIYHLATYDLSILHFNDRSHILTILIQNGIGHNNRKGYLVFTRGGNGWGMVTLIRESWSGNAFRRIYVTTVANPVGETSHLPLDNLQLSFETFDEVHPPFEGVVVLFDSRSLGPYNFGHVLNELLLTSDLPVQLVKAILPCLMSGV
jgi:hypothetical protein